MTRNLSISYLVGGLGGMSWLVLLVCSAASQEHQHNDSQLHRRFFLCSDQSQVLPFPCPPTVTSDAKVLYSQGEGFSFFDTNEFLTEYDSSTTRRLTDGPPS
ncbi:hypothetical protein BJV77DRAFT_102428 [Russula vinacea]|nr:hypothetical protein BJV77DRAFT_102428 [Russula vinacea]